MLNVNRFSRIIRVSACDMYQGKVFILNDKEYVFVRSTKTTVIAHLVEDGRQYRLTIGEQLSRETYGFDVIGVCNDIQTMMQHNDINILKEGDLFVIQRSYKKTTTGCSFVSEIFIFDKKDRNWIYGINPIDGRSVKLHIYRFPVSKIENLPMVKLANKENTNVDEPVVIADLQ
jgi:hypothetical protein